jgi:hypothetical protein
MLKGLKDSVTIKLVRNLVDFLTAVEESMFGIGDNKDLKELEEALRVLTKSFSQPYSPRRTINIAVPFNTYMALKALCRHRRLTITRGHDEILRPALIEEYKKDVAVGKLKFTAPEEPVQ